MAKHNHGFVDTYDGLVGFGFDRKVNEATLTWYIQKFSDDEHMAVMRERMSDEDLEALFNHLARLLKTYLKEEEYHTIFLKNEEE